MTDKYYRLWKIKIRKWNKLFVTIILITCLCTFRLDELIFGINNPQNGDDGAPGRVMSKAENKEFSRGLWNHIKIQELVLFPHTKKKTVLFTDPINPENNKPVEVITNENGSLLYQKTPPNYDNLLQVVMDTRDRCRNASDYDALIAVHSAVDHLENRATFRWLYGDFTKSSPFRFKVVFFLGLATNTTLQEELQKENEKHGDTVQGNFIDNYLNMTYKAILVFHWLDTRCQGIRGLFRVDDDVFMKIQNLYYLWRHVQMKHKSKTIMCMRIKFDKVLRTGKWAVPSSLIPSNFYSFRRCPGFFAAISVDLIHDIHVKARKMPFFWIDDIVVLGLVPQAIKGVYIQSIFKNAATRRMSFLECLEKQGANCKYFVGEANITNFSKMYNLLSVNKTEFVKSPK